jgi:N-acetylneuraminate synthase
MKIYIIAEIGINHNGDFELAKELIDKAAQAGCDAVKFQKRTIDKVYSFEELESARRSPWGTTNREQKEGLELDIEQYQELEKHSKSLGLDFVVSCWDIDSVNLVEKYLSVDYHKIASALITDMKLLRALNATGKEIILSTGMSSSMQVDNAVKALNNLKFILACTSTYPTKPEDVNLLYVTGLKDAHSQFQIGFSNHYNGLIACIGAVILGAECIEFHITKDRTLYGSDQAASIEDVDDMVYGIRKAELMRGTATKEILSSEIPVLDKLRKIP